MILARLPSPAYSGVKNEHELCAPRMESRESMLEVSISAIRSRCWLWGQCLQFRQIPSRYAHRGLVEHAYVALVHLSVAEICNHAAKPADDGVDILLRRACIRHRLVKRPWVLDEKVMPVLGNAVSLQQYAQNPSRVASKL